MKKTLDTVGPPWMKSSKTNKKINVSANQELNESMSEE
jgi:hypothetical protein